ncbi:unnamed protein product [Rotaria sp. Silwood1]|nr:unnamed protein product [Rotaria sp. Silwood1]
MYLQTCDWLTRATCSDPSLCLSQWGYCGTGSAYCGTGCQAGPCTGTTTIVSSTTSGAGLGCSDSSLCLSQWGYCGTGSAYCGTGCQAGPCTGTTVTTARTIAATTKATTAKATTTTTTTTIRTTATPITTRTNLVTTSATSGGGLSCSDPSLCLSQWGYCGTGSAYCGTGCQAGPCTGITTTTIRTATTVSSSTNGNGSIAIINDSTFACVFNTINSTLRATRFDGLKATGWTPVNNDEAAVFLAHVFHETGGLSTMREYCAPGCGSQYSGSWCSISAAPGKLYYGRGWFQLSWPCNYYSAGLSLGVDLLADPDKVENDPQLAVSTALWFYNANGMAAPAQIGDFAATTRIINGALECNNGPGYANQLTRYKASLRKIKTTAVFRYSDLIIEGKIRTNQYDYFFVKYV